VSGTSSMPTCPAQPTLPGTRLHPFACRAPSTEGTGLRTFLDVASRPAAAPEDVQRQDLVGAAALAAQGDLGRGSCPRISLALSCVEQRAAPFTPLQLGAMRAAYNSTAPAPAATAAGAAAAAAAGGGGAVAAVPGGVSLEDLQPEALPVDWSLKLGLTFSSRSRFACHDRAKQAPARTRGAGDLLSCARISASAHVPLARQQAGRDGLSWRGPSVLYRQAVWPFRLTSPPWRARAGHAAMRGVVNCDIPNSGDQASSAARTAPAATASPPPP
jgi:hypothetical protein